ncbi:MAG: glycosyltransferase family 4 protein [Nevskiales bacterium]|nr:glycosyltransferase family 4 protein [Nevskiales bacterium]
MELIQVVRNFGRVGGMENYVWELTHALARRGHALTVLCAAQHHEPEDRSIRVVTLDAGDARSNWWSQIRFAATVEAWLRVHPAPRRIVHSHERLRVHHVTTFHTMPFLHPKTRPGLSALSPRVSAQLHLERRELTAPSVRAIVPVSPVVAAALERRYPEIAARLKPPVLPATRLVPPRPAQRVPESGGRIGFIGREWKRKGLPLAVKIVRALSAARPQLEFVVSGPDPAEIRHLFRNVPFRYRLLGWQDAASLYAELDLLLHPASSEAFGMVLTEALSAGVPVAASSACGAAGVVRQQGGTVMTLEERPVAWAKACGELLQRTESFPMYRRSPEQLAGEYEQIYAGCDLTS